MPTYAFGGRRIDCPGEVVKLGPQDEPGSGFAEQQWAAAKEVYIYDGGLFRSHAFQRNLDLPDSSLKRYELWLIAKKWGAGKVAQTGHSDSPIICTHNTSYLKIKGSQHGKLFRGKAYLKHRARELGGFLSLCIQGIAAKS